MRVPAEFAKQFAKFPECLRTLAEAELADGNAIIEICGGFPAAPCGDCLKLARHVAACRRESAGGVDFDERNNPDYLGEFTTKERHFFVLEPPRPPEPAPDMDAIRVEIAARQQAADAELIARIEKTQKRLAKIARKESGGLVRGKKKKGGISQPPAGAGDAEPSGNVARFVENMKRSLEQWRGGAGYDLDPLKNATPEELAEIENILLNLPIEDWRDVEALAALDSPRARALLRKALASGSHRMTTAVVQYAPDLISDSERTEVVVAAIEGSEIYGGLTQAMLEVEEFHPPEIIAALNRDGGNAAHFAAMLMFLHGEAESSFDWEQRPFFLRFHTEICAERESVFRELCEKIGVDPEPPIRVSGGEEGSAKIEVSDAVTPGWR